MKNSLVIVGSGGQGREILALIEDINDESEAFEVIAFVNTDKEVDLPAYAGIPVYGKSFFDRSDVSGVAVAVGSGVPQLRRRIVQVLGDAVTYPTLVHPSVIRSKRVTLAQGVIVAAGCILTTDIVIRPHALINFSSTIGHDAVIGEYSVILPGANISGGVHVGNGVSIGTGAQVIQTKIIGEWSIVGAGAVVVSDVPVNSTVVGVPARVIASREPGWHLW